MPKSRKRKRTPSRIPIVPPLRSPRSRLREVLLRWTLNLPDTIKNPISGIFGLIAVLSGVVTLLPRVNIEHQSEIDPLQNSTIAFDIVNAGPVRLSDVKATIGVCHLIFEGNAARTSISLISEDAKDRGCKDSLYGTRLPFRPYPNRTLVSDERWTVSLDEFPALTEFTSAPPKFLSFSVFVTYKPWIFPFEQRVERKFETRRGRDGKLY